MKFVFQVRDVLILYISVFFNFLILLKTKAVQSDLCLEFLMNHIILVVIRLKFVSFNNFLLNKHQPVAQSCHASDRK